MDVANLPVEKAVEPNEQARQPGVDKEKCHNVTFTDTTLYISQDNSVYKDVLSQPPNGITHKQKLMWLQQRRTEGLWAQCDDCDRWRYLPQALDRHQLPAKWYCWMNSDKSLATCSAPEVPICLYDEDDLIHAEYAAGSVVLARMPGFPWWPAMVCDCPDTEQYYWLDGFSDIPTHYNVVFFDAFEVSRAWMTPAQLIPYNDNTKLMKKSMKLKRYRGRLDIAIKQANDATKLSLSARLAKYSFIARFKGSIVTPKKVKKHEIDKYRNILKRKFNVDFSDESLSESEEEIVNNDKNKSKNQEKKHRKVKGVTKNNNKIDSSVAMESAAEAFNITKSLNSLAVQIDTNSGLLKSLVSEVSDKTTDKNQETNTASDLLPCETLPTQDKGTAFTLNEDPTENSDDFDF